MNRYTVISSRVWKHKDGKTASIYGSCPWYSWFERKDWHIEVRGYTIEDTKSNEIGRVCHGPMPLGKAQDLCQRLNKG